MLSQLILPISPNARSPAWCVSFSHFNLAKLCFSFLSFLHQHHLWSLCLCHGVCKGCRFRCPSWLQFPARSLKTFSPNNASLCASGVNTNTFHVSWDHSSQRTVEGKLVNIFSKENITDTVGIVCDIKHYFCGRTYQWKLVTYKFTCLGRRIAMTESSKRVWSCYFDGKIVA